MKWKQPKVGFAIFVLVLMVSAIGIVCIDIWRIKAKLSDLYWIAENTHSGMVTSAIQRAESLLHQRLTLLTVLALLTVSTILVVGLLIKKHKLMRVHISLLLISVFVYRVSEKFLNSKHREK